MLELWFDVTWVDINEWMLEIAKEKNENAVFIKDSMQIFRTKEKYDIITCLFTSINYNKTLFELWTTLKNFYYNLNSGWVVIFDLWIVKWNDSNKSWTFLDTYVDDSIEIWRISQWWLSKNEKNMFSLNSLIFVKDNWKIDFEVDEHSLWFFSFKEVENIMLERWIETSVYDDFTLNAYTVNSRRPVFVWIKS